MGNVYMEAEQIRFKNGTYKDVQSGLTAALQESGGGAAEDITYDNTESGLTADDVQAAIDELSGDLSSIVADDVSYDGTTSGLEATDVQGAIDEMVSNFSDGVDDVYDACVAKGSTPASHSLSDILTAIGSISSNGNIEKLYTGIGEDSNLNISETFTAEKSGYFMAIGWNYMNSASIKLNNDASTEMMEAASGYAFAIKPSKAIVAAEANDVLTYTTTGSGTCKDFIDIYFVSDVVIS